LHEALDWRNENSYEDSQRLISEFIFKYNEHPEVTYRKAAQAYADLPSKIKGMKMNLPDVFKDSGIIKECYEMRETTLDDILNLLKEDV
jgi:hypothetical protein